MKADQYLKRLSNCIEASASLVAGLPLAKRVVPAPVRHWIFKQRQNLSVYPPRGWVSARQLWRVTPISRVFGFDRGTPVDRYYIEDFLAQHRQDIRGHVLEVAADQYTSKYGADRVTRLDVLHVCEGNPNATIVADLTAGENLPSDTFDCIILTQTLQFIYELRPAIRTLHRILKPGGVLLATVPGISQISRYDMERWGDHWRFTTLTARKIFVEFFSPAEVSTESYGNVLAANALLHGLAVEELRRQELEYRDHDYQIIVTVRAVKEEHSERKPAAGALALLVSRVLEDMPFSDCPQVVSLVL